MRVAVFAIALVIRLIAIEVTGANRIAFGDARDYAAHAASICTEQTYPERGTLPFFRAPGLPFFIVAATACHPGSVRAIKYGLALCDALTCVLIASIALLLFGRCAAWLAALGGTIHPVFIASVCDVRTEPLFMLLITLALWLLLLRREVPAGVTTALAALTRPAALLCIPLFALFRPRRAAAFAIAALLTLTPWTARNLIRFHEVIIINDAGGFSFWRGTAPETIAITNELNRAEYRDKAERFELNTVVAATQSVDRVAHSPAERSRAFRGLALRNIAGARREEALFTLEKAWLYWRPWLNPQEYSPRIVAASALFFIPLYILGAIGIASDRERRTAIIALFAVMWLAHLPYQIGLRLRLPFTDPLMLVFAASVLCKRYERADTSGPPAGRESP